jgi:hypothetical protein
MVSSAIWTTSKQFLRRRRTCIFLPSFVPIYGIYPSMILFIFPYHEDAQPHDVHWSSTSGSIPVRQSHQCSLSSCSPASHRSAY